MFVPDLLHEFELGVWKAVFTQLLRILDSLKGTAIQQLNKRCVSLDIVAALVLIPHDRYRLVPTFGRSTIRRFCNNASEMKKLAARDFEDLLQVCSYS